jgi:hypothetical protein
MQQVDEATETGKSSFLVAATQHANSFQVPTGAPLYPREWFAAHGKSTGNSSALMSILNASMASFSIGSSSRSIMEQADYYDTYMESENNIGSSSDTSIDTRSTKKRRKKPKRIIDESQAIEPSANDILFVSRNRYCVAYFRYDEIMYSHTLWYNAPDRDEAVIRTRTQVTFVFE